jgi:eukaryotic-like serine/threonine-protein kinase
MGPSQLPTARVPSGEDPHEARTARPVSGEDPHEARTAPRGPRRRTREPRLVLERYRLDRRLGAGGFGTVWLARDERLERDVAIKILPRERVVGGRFEREARAAARLSHPGIVTLYEAAVDDDGAYLVSELVRGETLGDMLDAGRMSDHDIAQVAIVICDALAHAHAHGIVHRDVKPSNVLIPEHPPSPSQLAKLTDFGVARVIGGTTLTRTGDVVGTAAYMAPEQAEGLKVGAAADVYSLALVTYEALTGVNPVRTTTAAQRARRLGAHLPPLRRQRRDLPQGLGRAVDLALRPRARERGSLGELQAALVEALPTLAETPGVVTSPWPRLAADPATGDHEIDAARWSDATGAEAPRAGARPAPHTDAPASEAEAEAVQMPAWPERGLAGAATSALTWWLSTSVLAHPVIAPAAAALVAAVIVAALPRIGWVVAMGSLVVSAAAQQRPGAAVLIAVGALVPIVLMPRRGTAWSLAAGAPALALVGLGGAWPALAARGGTAWRRAALGATGWIWIVLTVPLVGTSAYLNRLPGTPPLHIWSASLNQTATVVLRPILTSGALAAAPVWAIAAVTLPWLVRNRSLTLDTVFVVVWSATLVSATGAAISIVHAGTTQPTERTALIGAFAGALIALAPSLRERLRTGRDPAGVS